MELTHEQEARAKRLHDDSIILLAHDHFFPPTDLSNLRRGNVTAKILMGVVDARLWSPDHDDYQRSITQLDGWFSYAQQIYEGILREIASTAEIALIRDTQDVLQVK